MFRVYRVLWGLGPRVCRVKCFGFVGFTVNKLGGLGFRAWDLAWHPRLRRNPIESFLGFRA